MYNKINRRRSMYVLLPSNRDLLHIDSSNFFLKNHTRLLTNSPAVQGHSGLGMREGMSQIQLNKIVTNISLKC